MTWTIFAAYRGALGERLSARPARAEGWLERAEADRLAERLAEVYADAPRLAPSPASLAGARLAVGFGASPTRALGAALGGDEDADLSTRRLSWRLARSGFGERLFAGAKHAMLIGEETMLADPIPGLIASARVRDEGWEAVGPFVESALRALAALEPLVDAGRLALVGMNDGQGAEDAPPVDLRADEAQRAVWSAAIDALNAADAPPSKAAVDAAARDYRRLSAAGDADPIFVSPDAAPAPAARRFAEMAAAAESYDLRALGAEAASLDARSLRDALAAARWDGWSDDAEDLPRLDAPTLADGGATLALDLGVAVDPEKLPLAEAVALALGDETIAARRDLAADIAVETLAGGAPSEELLDRLTVWRRLSEERLPRLPGGDAFRGDRRVARALRSRPPLSSAAREGLVAVAEDWPEQALIADLAEDVRRAVAPEAGDDHASAPERRRGGSISLIAPPAR